MSFVVFLSYEIGGAATYQAQQINFLLSNNHQVALLDENPEPTLQKVLFSPSERFQVFQTPVWSDPARVRDELHALLRQGDKCFVSLSNPGLMIKYLRILKEAAKYKRINVVITIHSGMLTMTLRRLFLEWASSFAFLYMDEIIYVSEFTRRYWENRYPWMRWCNARVVHNGVELPDNIMPSSTPKQIRVGFVGRLHREKDPVLFCQTARLSLQEGHNASFHLFGEGPLLEQIKREYSEEVVVHGWRHAVDIYSSIDLLLITSPVENCPYSLLEAKSYAAPVISGTVGGIPEIVENGIDGILTGKRSPEAFMAAIREIQERLSLFSQGCLETRKLYSAKQKSKETWSTRGLHVETRI